MSLSAAAVFAPYVRLELLQWDPIFTGRAGMNPHCLSVLCQPVKYAEVCGADARELSHFQILLAHALVV